MDEARAAAERTLAEALGAIDAGDRRPASELLPLVYDVLREAARRMLGGERPEARPSPTSLVHQAYLKVAGRANGFESRQHFFNAAAQAMRRILVDHARRRNAKRGAGAEHVTLDGEAVLCPDRSDDFASLDDALIALAERAPRKAKVVELRFFGGLSVDETADVLGVSPITVMREWKSAKAWLYRELSGESGNGRRPLEPRR